MPETIWTVGHSTHPIEVFLDLLVAHGIMLIADVRLLPGSKRHPQFNREALAAALVSRGIGYEHFPGLGGRRRPRPDSHNTAWRNAAFRGYADHMETEIFAHEIARLMTLADATGPTALLCAEAVWWRCHRSLIADYLKVRGCEVLHIANAKKAAPHPYTSAATISAGQLSYRELS